VARVIDYFDSLSEHFDLGDFPEAGTSTFTQLPNDAEINTPTSINATSAGGIFMAERLIIDPGFGSREEKK
jgi:hypothetical protein